MSQHHFLFGLQVGFAESVFKEIFISGLEMVLKPFVELNIEEACLVFYCFYAGIVMMSYVGNKWQCIGKTAQKYV